MIIRFDDDAVHIESLDPFCAEMIRRLPDCAATDDEAASRRMFGAPTGGTDEEADAEWKEVVEPGLRALFESHVDVVRKDIATMKVGDDGEDLAFPLAHGQAWVHTLNQARLALGARHEVSEDDMQGRRSMEARDKAFAVMQIELFGIMLGVLLQRIEL